MAQKTELEIKAKIPIRKSFFLPHRSPKIPNGSKSRPKAKRYPVTTHSTSVKRELKCRAIVGKETFTALESNVAISGPNATAIKESHFVEDDFTKDLLKKSSVLNEETFIH